MYQLVDAFSIFVILYFVLLVFIGGFFLVNLTLAVIKGKFTDMQNFGEEVNEVHEDTDNIDIQQIKNFRRMERLFIRKIVLKNVMAAKYGGLKNQNLDYLDQFSAAHNFDWDVQIKILQSKKQQEKHKSRVKTKNSIVSGSHDSQVVRPLNYLQQQKDKLKLASRNIQKLSNSSSLRNKIPDQKIIYHQSTV